MNVVVDTNIFLDVLFDRQDLCDESSAALDIFQHPGIHGWICWHTLSNLYYIGERSLGRKTVLKELDCILCVYEICPVSTVDALRARTLKLKDFEDALQVAGAMAVNADSILTRNKRDFRQSPIPALTPKEFLSLFENPS